VLDFTARVHDVVDADRRGPQRRDWNYPTATSFFFTDQFLREEFTGPIPLIAKDGSVSSLSLCTADDLTDPVSATHLHI
jgi:hypothetical protein